MDKPKLFIQINCFNISGMHLKFYLETFIFYKLKRLFQKNF